MLADGGERVEAAVSTDGLDFGVSIGRRHVPWGDIVFRHGGFDGQRLLLFWRSGDEQWSAMLLDAAHLVVFEPYLGSSQLQQLQQWKQYVRRSENRIRVGIGAIGIFLALPVLILVALVLMGGQIAAWAAGKISVETEQKIGAALFEQARLQMEFVEDPQVTTFLTELGGRLTRGSTYAYRWYVARDASVNAMAIPAGYIVVNSGLLAAVKSPEEVAGVMAHEIQHIEQRHSLRGLLHSLGWTAVVASVFGTVETNVVSAIAGELGRLKFSRTQEQEADLGALSILEREGIDPAGMLTFFTRLSGDNATSIELLSTHPTSHSRLDVLKGEITRLDQREYIALYRNDWAQLQERFSAINQDFNIHPTGSTRNFIHSKLLLSH